MDLTFDWILSILLVCMCVNNSSHASDCPKVDMWQEDYGNRSIGSFVTVISKVYDGNVTSDEDVLIQLYTGPMDIDKVGDITYDRWNNTTPIPGSSNLNTSFTDLTLSVRYENLTRIFTWDFTHLLNSSNGLVLRTTVITPRCPQGQAEATSTLHVLECESPQSVSALKQTATYSIIANSVGHYDKKGNCSCDNGGTLFHPNGTVNTNTATCNLYANWTGCEDSQCWKAPANVAAVQLNTTVNAENPFNCSYDDGFPTESTTVYKIDNETQPSPYTLKSSDNGKNLSCEVVSNYTTATDEMAESPPKKIIVYFAPENVSLSNDTITIPLNGTENLLFSFYANPSEGNLSTYVKFFNPDNDVPDGLFNWSNDITKIGDTTRYERVLEMNLTSAEETQTYAVCANCSSPEGEACAKLTFSNKVSTTFKPTDITGTTFKYTVDAGNPYPEYEGISTGIIIGAAVGVLAVLVIVIAVVYFMRRKHGNIKEERINEIYEASPGPGPSIETVNTGTGENSRSEMTANVAYEASPHQPEIQDVYTTVNREDKKKGRTEKDESKNGNAAATSAEENVPAVTDVYAMVKK